VKTIIVNCGEIAHLSSGDISMPLSGAEMTDFDNLIYGPGYAIIIEKGIISKISNNEEIINEFIPWFQEGDSQTDEYNIIDACQSALTPGFVDSHSHLVWSGDRSNELSLRQNGKSYSDISKLGGGIKKTVNATRDESFKSLIDNSLRRADIAISLGTTTLEAKSGYGLNYLTEINSLKAIDEVSKNSNCKIIPTWLGAHDFPEGQLRSDYVDELINIQLPTIVEDNLAKYVDVFCEPGWYTSEETELIVNESKKLGLIPRLHVDEFIDSDGLKLATELGSVSGDHVAYSSDDSRSFASSNGTMQTFLPGTPYVLGKPISLPISKCIDEGWSFSIASDFNPNCPSLSLPFVGSLLSHRLSIDPTISLIAATRNPATTILDNLTTGCLTVGASADINFLWSNYVSGWCQTPGMNPIRKTMINGNIVNSNNVI
jgi:imidazolonepropionase